MQKVKVTLPSARPLLLLYNKSTESKVEIERHTTSSSVALFSPAKAK